MALIPAEKEIGQVGLSAGAISQTGSTALTISLKAALFWAVAAIAAFQIAYTSPPLSGVILVYVISLVQIARVRSGRLAFYIGLSVGFLVAASQLYCFWTIFGPSAIALWMVLGFWIGLFVTLARVCFLRFGKVRAALLIPFLWTGLEYFRSELYYLRFSWLNAGYAFSESAVLPVFKWLGMYGVGFLCAGLAALFNYAFSKKKWWVTAAVVSLCLVPWAWPLNKTSSEPAPSAKRVRVAGVQLEFVAEPEVIAALDRLTKLVPDAGLLMLSEYTLDGPVPEKIKTWCREHKRYLLVGGKEPASGANFYDTAFVVGPTGEIVFSQGKSVPIQFFKDGLPAREQKLWESPWGKIGICICYDLSYTRVTDRLIRMGAQAVLVPTMDVADWGKREHELHAMVAPIRAAEYGVPIFRVASSGISQFVDSQGRVMVDAGFPEPEQPLSAILEPVIPGKLPFDRVFAPVAALIAGLTTLWGLLGAWQDWRKNRFKNQMKGITQASLLL